MRCNRSSLTRSAGVGWGRTPAFLAECVVLLARLAERDAECARVGGFASSKTVGEERFQVVLAECVMLLARLAEPDVECDRVDGYASSK